MHEADTRVHSRSDDITNHSGVMSFTYGRDTLCSVIGLTKHNHLARQ